MYFGAYKKLVLFSLCSFLSSCSMPNQGLSTLAQSNINVERLTQLSPGMTQKQVLEIMHKPYSYETFHINPDVYDVWFYVTHPTVLGQSRLVPQNLTPLAFKNGIYVGMGYTYYNHYLDLENERVPPAQEKKPLAMSDEKKSQSSASSNDDETEEEPPPDEQGREMLRDDAEDDFDTW